MYRIFKRKFENCFFKSSVKFINSFFEHWQNNHENTPIHLEIKMFYKKKVKITP